MKLVDPEGIIECILMVLLMKSKSHLLIQKKRHALGLAVFFPELNHTEETSARTIIKVQKTYFMAHFKKIFLKQKCQNYTL